MPAKNSAPTSLLLAVDAGGTSTRAVLVDTDGRAHGSGRSSGGNPTAVGVDGAVTAIGEAAIQAAASGPKGARHTTATIAMAGEKTPAFAEQVTDRLGALGWGQVVLQHDLLGVFGSGTHLLDGYALIAGTGSVAARVVGGRLAHVIGGRGWLLGDAGSGFWIGQQVARAVIAALDGQQPPTALTPLVLGAVGVETDLRSAAGRVRAVRALMSWCYARPPVQLAALAPLAFAAHDDSTARAILMSASQALADLVAALAVPEVSGPIVAGGSVLVRGILAAPADLHRQLAQIAGGAELTPVSDGVVGTAVLALRGAGVDVDEAMFTRVRAEVERYVP